MEISKFSETSKSYLVKVGDVNFYVSPSYKGKRGYGATIKSWKIMFADGSEKTGFKSKKAALDYIKTNHE